MYSISTIWPNMLLFWRWPMWVDSLALCLLCANAVGAAAAAAVVGISLHFRFVVFRAIHMCDTKCNFDSGANSFVIFSTVWLAGWLALNTIALDYFYLLVVAAAAAFPCVSLCTYVCVCRYSRACVCIYINVFIFMVMQKANRFSHNSLSLYINRFRLY